MDTFILASSSKRRIDLLKQIGYIPAQIIPAEIDETPKKSELARQYCKRIALEKAKAISEKFPQTLVLAGDTIVTVGRKILGKPSSVEEAVRFLKLLSGRRHQVLTAICFVKGDEVNIKLVKTIVKFKCLTEQEIEFHTQSNEWQDKSGGYMIQGIAASFIIRINGSFSNVIGLPLYETANLLKKFGIGPNKN